VKKIGKDKEIPDCLKWLDDIIGKQEVLHDMNYIDNNKQI
jgi:hypothetical protein